MAGIPLLLDLDGTLTDSRRGVVGCIRHALERLGRRAPPDHELTRFVGPPLAASFQELLATSDAPLVERAIAEYRDRYERVGLSENEVYPGVREALEQLASEGHHLRIVTAKPRAVAARVVEMFGLADFFRGIHGPGLEQRHYTKAFLIDEALVASNAGDRHALMIGDRSDDVLAAREAGVGSVAVTWGYGTREELERAGPDLFVDTPAALADCIRALQRA